MCYELEKENGTGNLRRWWMTGLEACIAAGRVTCWRLLFLREVAFCWFFMMILGSDGNGRTFESNGEMTDWFEGSGR